MKAIILGLLATALFGGATRAGASALVNNVGLATPHQTITFSELAFDTGTAIANQFAGLQVTFTPSLYYNVQPIYFPTASSTGRCCPLHLIRDWLTSNFQSCRCSVLAVI